VQYDEPWARLDAHVDGPDGLSARTIKIIHEPTPSKTYEIEGRVYRRLLAAKTLPVVIFEPNHLFMLSGSPDLRRTYLDDLLEQIDPHFGRLRKDYRRVLTQRNALLKRYGMEAASQIFPWNVRLSELGGSVAVARMQLLERMNDDASELYSSLAHRETLVELRYDTKLPTSSYGTSLLRALEANFNLDVARGFTGAGPHREDISVLIGGRLTQTSASRGEARTAVLMLKVMELKLIEAARGHSPLLLLDDVFSELDGKRRQALTGYLQSYQTFITTTDADVVIEHFMDTSTIIPLGA
jgi:DNA replication and repair protein RecF